MGDTRRRSLWSAVIAVVVGALVVTPAASALGERTPTAARTGGVAAALDPGKPGHEHESSDFQNSFVEAGHLNAEAAAADGGTPSAVSLPTGFSDQEVITGMSEAVSADFAPDGTAFIALKTGQVKVAAYDQASDTWGAPTDFADLQTQVNNYGDRGLTGIAVDPKFPTRPYIYVNYTYDKDPRDGAAGVVPKWGRGTAYDVCDVPADENDETVTGCIVQDRVTRLTASKQSGSWRMTSERELLVGGCYQFSSHASGDVAFGPDGKLYASSGEGASFNTLDTGQYANACGDPADEGGSLRSQDYRSNSDPLGVDGSVFRMDPDTGVVPTQQNAASWLVAYGQRNPWRLAFRQEADGSGPTGELWSVDVGASKAEEVNRIADVTSTTTPANRGWPCYEGDLDESKVQPGWDALNLPLCESLYSQGLSAVQKPFFSYQTRDGGPLVDGEDCANETSSVSGVAFVTATENNYPSAYRNTMFFSDFARSCIWVLEKGSDGTADPKKIRTFVQAASTPADLLTGPGGDLYYVDYGLTPQGGVGQGIAGVHRIVYTGSNATPTARITADKLSGPAPLSVNLSGATSTDPDGDPLTYRWDFENDGTWDASGVTASKQYGVGTWTAKLEVDDGRGHVHTTTVQVQAGNSAPTLTSVTPSADLTWATGDTISYNATATDAQPGTLTYTWQVEIRHCPSQVCHTHPFGTYTGASGSFRAPPHEYPSKLGLSVTVTDSGGLTDTESFELSPKTVAVSFASTPSGAGVTVGESDHTAPYTETFIQKSPFTVTAAPTTGSGASIAAFSSWSDGGARSHSVNPGTTPSTLTATYTRPTAGLGADRVYGSAPLTVNYTASGTNAGGVTGGFSYAWDLDGDGQYDDGAGTTQAQTYSTPGTRTVRVLVTDTRGATDSKSVVVRVGDNRVPTARIVTNPSPASGTAPLAVTFDGSTSSDADGDTLTYAWDLDGDGQYDDSAVAQPSATYPVGTVTVGLEVTDGRGVTARASTRVTATNTAPFLTRVTTYPAGGFSTGQRLGFDAAASDLQEQVPDSAYSFVMYRQDCVSACPRTPVQRWDGVQNGQFTVPQLPFPSRLVLVATVRDSQGLTATRELVVEPQAATLRVKGTRKVPVTLDGETGRTVTKTVVAGSTVTVSAKKVVTRKGVRYRFVKWSDGGARTHAVAAWAASTTITAKYRRLG